MWFCHVIRGARARRKWYKSDVTTTLSLSPFFFKKKAVRPVRARGGETTAFRRSLSSNRPHLATKRRKSKKNRKTDKRPKRRQPPYSLAALTAGIQKLTPQLKEKEEESCRNDYVNAVRRG